VTARVAEAVLCLPLHARMDERTLGRVEDAIARAGAAQGGDAMKLSVVIPVFNEAAVLGELARRARAAALACAAAAEVIFVDDASTDATRALAAGLADAVVRFVHLDSNRGQTGATLEGVARARGRVVVVLDGDLQDPPEHIPALYAALEAEPAAAVAYAVKRARHEPLGSRAAFALYHALQGAFGDLALPSDAGSFCAFRAGLAEGLLAAPRSRANLATLLAGQRRRYVAVPYEKHARADGRSRVGAAGLCREALDSLAATGALGNLARAAAVASAGLSVAVAPQVWRAHAGLAALAVGAVGVALAAHRERRFAAERAAGAGAAR
jgi:glycosyltransferase involved in cell wall biosynthesis